MAANDERCVLCGLDVGNRPCLLQTTDGCLKFCCDGCLGIYRLLNDCDEDADPTPQQAGVDLTSDKGTR